MINYYLREIMRRYQVYAFNKAAVGVLNLPKVLISESGPYVLSMVQHRDVLPYLAAVKSFTRYVNVSGVVIIADKTITDSDKDIFREQIPSVTIRDASDFYRNDVPVGGTWERLVAISHYIKENYVVQIDADTLTISNPSTVKSLINKKISFALGTFDLQAKIAIGEVARWAQYHCQNIDKPHIQLLCESNLAIASDGDLSKEYIRGCSGFAGFGRESFTEDDLMGLSKRMTARLGEKWSAWGTEQFASNFIISNISDSSVLPHPVYTTPDKIIKTTEFVHFIGPLRYSGGKYKKLLNIFLNSTA